MSNNFPCISSLGCGGVYNQNSGVISSPSHPQFYPHGVNCTWYITVDPGKVVRLNFHTFVLERPSYNGQCHDKLEVFDNSTMYGPSLMNRYLLL